jgi:hypothetical protein
MSNFLEQSRFSPIPPAPSNVKYKAAALMPQPRRLAGEPFRAIAGFPAPAPNLPPPHADSQTKVTQSPKNVKSATIEYTPIFAEGRLGVSNIQPFNRNFCHAISPHSSHWSHESHSPAAILISDSSSSSLPPRAAQKKPSPEGLPSFTWRGQGEGELISRRANASRLAVLALTLLLTKA